MDLLKEIWVYVRPDLSMTAEGHGNMQEETSWDL